MDGFEWLVYVERGKKSYLWPTDDKEYDRQVVFTDGARDGAQDCYLGLPVVTLVKAVYDNELWGGNGSSWYSLERFDKEGINLCLNIFLEYSWILLNSVLYVNPGLRN